MVFEKSFTGSYTIEASFCDCGIMWNLSSSACNITNSELVPNKYLDNENVAPKALFHFSPLPLMFFEMSFPRKYMPMTTTKKIPKKTATRVLIEPSVAPIIFATDSDKYTAA